MCLVCVNVSDTSVRYALIELMRAIALGATSRRFYKHICSKLSQTSVFCESLERAGTAARYLLKARNENEFFASVNDDKTSGVLTRELGAYVLFAVYFYRHDLTSKGASRQVARDSFVEVNVYRTWTNTETVPVKEVLLRLYDWGMAVSHFNVCALLAEEPRASAFGPLTARVIDDTEISTQSVRSGIMRLLLAFNMKEHLYAFKFVVCKLPEMLPPNASATSPVSSSRVSLIPRITTCLVMHRDSLWALNFLNAVVDLDPSCEEDMAEFANAIEICFASEQPMLRETSIKSICFVSHRKTGTEEELNRIVALVKSIKYTELLFLCIVKAFALFKLLNKWVEIDLCLHDPARWASLPALSAFDTQLKEREATKQALPLVMNSPQIVCEVDCFFEDLDSITEDRRKYRDERFHIEDRGE